MINQLRSEFYRTSKFKSIFIMPSIVTAFILISVLTIWSVLQHFGGATMPPGFLASNGYTGKFIIYQFSSNGNLTLLIAIFACISIAGSFSNGSIKTSIMRGANRVELYLSKLISVSTFIAALSIFSFLISVAVSPIVGYGQEFNWSEFGGLMATLAMQIIVALGYTSLFVFIASLIRSTGGSLAASIGIFILGSILSAAFLILGSFSESGWLINALQGLLSTQLSTAMRIGALDTWEILCVVLVPLGYIAITTGLGILAFVKRDVK
ncbi:MAG: ABC transporter permease subunit [Clostridia bacterium]|nr:ABC transporter permease subunit [Clostridia bacterium]